MSSVFFQRKHVGRAAAWVIVAGWALAGNAALAAPADSAAQIADAVKDAKGILVHAVDSPRQAERTELRVLLPDGYSAQRKYRVLYVLPVEPGRERKFGDGLEEVLNRDLHNRHQWIAVQPTFAHMPWYADHPKNQRIQQERYLIEDVLPFIERTYSVVPGAAGRLLLGFSKSGWGAWSLLLRHPNRFSAAAAWDTPCMLDAPGKYGSGAIFGTPENFEQYQLSALVRKRAGELGSAPRLALLGYSAFRAEHAAMHQLLDELKIPHEYRDGPQRPHVWESGWMVEAAEFLAGRQQ